MYGMNNTGFEQAKPPVYVYVCVSSLIETPKLYGGIDNHAISKSKSGCASSSYGRKHSFSYW